MPSVRQTTRRPLGIFELVVKEAPQVPDTVREVRRRSSLGVAEIVRRIGTADPIVVVDTTDFPIGVDRSEGYKGRHKHFLEAYEALVSLGDTVIIQYKPSGDWEPEVVDLPMAQNLMASELLDAHQEHD